MVEAVKTCKRLDESTFAYNYYKTIEEKVEVFVELYKKAVMYSYDFLKKGRMTDYQIRRFKDGDWSYVEKHCRALKDYTDKKTGEKVEGIYTKMRSIESFNLFVPKFKFDYTSIDTLVESLDSLRILIMNREVIVKIKGHPMQKEMLGFLTEEPCLDHTLLNSKRADSFKYSEEWLPENQPTVALKVKVKEVPVEEEEDVITYLGSSRIQRVVEEDLFKNTNTFGLPEGELAKLAKILKRFNK